MATLTAYQQFNMNSLGSGVLSTSNSSSLFFTTGGSYQQLFYGSYTISEGVVQSGTTTSVAISSSDGSTSVAAIGNFTQDAAYSWDLVDLGNFTSLYSSILAGDDTLTGSFDNDYLIGFDGKDILRGDSGNDTLDGGFDNDSLEGGSGTDSMIGGMGNDTLNGGTSRDTLVGGSGNDVYYADRTAEVVTELVGEGTDTVISTAVFTLSDNVENLTLSGTLALTGDGNALGNILTGNSGANRLNGLDGNDTLEGGSGSDTLDGGSGDDTYVTAAGDIIIDRGGLDTVRSSIGYTLGTGLENLILTGSTALVGKGNDNNNSITGNGLANSLYGYDGNDTLNGISGADSLSGGNGNDSLNGGSGDNSLSGGSGNDTLNGGTGNDALAGGSGNDVYIVDSTGDSIGETVTTSTEIDTVQSSVTWTLGSNLENLSLSGSDDINATGNALANTITGNAGDNTLNGGSGTGDTISYSPATTAVTVNLAVTTAQDTRGAGIDTLSNFENLTGSSKSDHLTGNTAANRIDGRQGDDTMYGGGGNDTYVVNSVGDKVQEYQNAGTDTIESSITWDLKLTPGVENLTLTGSGNINATGNGPNSAGNGRNILIGNAGSNILDGFLGNDSLDGGAGNDKLVGGLGSDTLTGGSGKDHFVVNTDIGTSNAPITDLITDFTVQDDTIVLDHLIFTALTVDYSYLDEPAWTEENFRIVNGATGAPAADGAQDANDFILYNDTTGALSYDADGSGAGVAVQFATLDAGLKLLGISAANFEVI